MKKQKEKKENHFFKCELISSKQTSVYLKILQQGSIIVLQISPRSTMYSIVMFSCFKLSMKRFDKQNVIYLSKFSFIFINMFVIFSC